MAGELLSHPLGFTWRVIKAFNANQGLLLSGAVAYYTLLSIIPIFTLLLVVLSHVIEDASLLHLVRENLQLFVRVAMDFPEKIQGDEKQLRQILFHLLAKAIKFTEKVQKPFIVRAEAIT